MKQLIQRAWAKVRGKKEPEPRNPHPVKAAKQKHPDFHEDGTIKRVTLRDGTKVEV